MQKFFDSVINREGQPVVQASVTVNVHDGALASLYDENGNPATNPFFTDDAGYYEFYAADGHYDIIISAVDFTTKTIRDVILDDPDDINPAIAAMIQYETDLVQQNLDAHLADTVGAHAATAISNTPAGNIAATTVQAAINELDTEKQAALGFTPENVANKSTNTSLGSSDTAYPSQNAVKVYADAGDAATLASAQSYADAVAQGLSVKQSVRLATAAALPTNVYSNGSSGVGATLTGVSTGALTVDGSTVALNDRILVKDESAGANNGIYKCTTAGALGVAYIFTRVTDLDQSAEFPGAFTFVETGTVNFSSGWVCANATAPTLGSTTISFTQFSGAGEITAGSALSKTGNTLDVNVDGSTIEVSADALRVKDAGITYAKIQNVSATSRVLGRKTAGAGVTEELTLSEILDFIGSAAQGDILYRGSSSWARLAAGTSGQFLKTQGAGANPIWADASGASAVVWLGRKTFTNQSAVTVGTVAAAASDIRIDWTAYDEYIFRLTRGKTGTAAAIQARFSTDGGTSFISANYGSYVTGYDEGAGTQTNNGSLAAQMNLSPNIRDNSTQMITFLMRILAPSDTAFYKNMEVGNMTFQQNGGNGCNITGGGHYQGSTAAINGVEWFMSSGSNNFTGVLDVYGMTHS